MTFHTGIQLYLLPLLYYTKVNIVILREICGQGKMTMNIMQEFNL